MSSLMDIATLLTCMMMTAKIRAQREKNFRMRLPAVRRHLRWLNV